MCKATSRIYIRNALGDAEAKPSPKDATWSSDVDHTVELFRKDIERHHPRLLLTFGAFAFEFVRRTKDQEEPRPYGLWSTTRLGNEFRLRLSNWTDDDYDVLPLLHASIARGRFLEAHRYYVGDQNLDANYFQFVGERLADLFLERFADTDVWEK